MADLNPTDEELLRYIDEDLPAAERSDIETKIAANDLLKSRVEELMLARDAVMHLGIRQSVADARATWESANAKKTPSPTKLVSLRKWLPYTVAAASIIIIVSLLAIFNGPSSPDKIYNDIYINYTLSNTRSEGGNVNEIEQAYQQKDYQTVIRLTENKPVPPKQQLLLGISRLETNDAAGSIRVLKGLQEQTNTPYHLDADFYLGLAYLKNKEYDNAIGAFQKIELDNTHPYRQQVTEKLLDDIKALKN